MTREDAIKHLENMKWLLGVNNTTVDDIPLTKVIDDIEALLKAQEPRVMAGAELTDAELIEEIRKAPITLKPAVDAVPVVRCRDCKHCFSCENDPMTPYDGETDWYCAEFDVDWHVLTLDPNRFYCANGERREDE